MLHVLCLKAWYRRKPANYGLIFPSLLLFARHFHRPSTSSMTSVKRPVLPPRGIRKFDTCGPAVQQRQWILQSRGRQHIYKRLYDINGRCLVHHYCRGDRPVWGCRSGALSPGELQGCSTRPEYCLLLQCSRTCAAMVDHGCRSVLRW